MNSGDEVKFLVDGKSVTGELIEETRKDEWLVAWMHNGSMRLNTRKIGELTKTGAEGKVPKDLKEGLTAAGFEEAIGGGYFPPSAEREPTAYTVEGDPIHDRSPSFLGGLPFTSDQMWDIWQAFKTAFSGDTAKAWEIWQKSPSTLGAPYSSLFIWSAESKAPTERPSGPSTEQQPQPEGKLAGFFASIPLGGWVLIGVGAVVYSNGGKF